jgi:RND superfamily putative drug exporter
MSKLLYRLGHWAVRHRRRVVLGWVAVLVAVVASSAAWGGSTSDVFEIPGTESQRAADLLDERFPEQGGSSARVVFAAPDGDALTDSENRQAIEATLAALADAPGVVGVASPFDTGAVSPEGDIAFADVGYGVSADEVPAEEFAALDAAVAPAEEAGIQVAFGGEVGETEELSHTSELIGLGVAVIVLLFSFGSVVAMGLPIVSALLGVGIGLTGITLVAGFTDLSSTAPTLAMMIGLAVGIDYALFIVTRHRQNLAEGHSVEESAARATATAGGAVVFAGMTVVIALAGLAVIGIPFLTVMGLAAAVTVFLAVVIAVTMLPALLGFAGHGIDRWRVGRARTGSAAEAHDTLSARWARSVISRPGRALVGGLAIMLVLAIPALSMRLGMPDDGSQPEGTTRRAAYDLLAEGFGPGFNGPFLIVVDTADAADPEVAVQAVATALADDPGILSVSDPQVNADGDTAVLTAIPRTSPSSPETEELVHHLRGDVLDDVAQATGAEASIAGSTASLIDVSDKMTSALPVFMLIVIGLTMLLLLVVFRSILVPIKAAIAILLSIASSFGVIVAVFQWGWLKDVIGLHETIPIISFLPMLMFAILFGLSMDYEVFILSRVREDYVRTRQARHSVLTGLTSSARVITAAALIMISVFASFILGDDPTIKMFGLGFSIAVLLDATVVRMMIVPAVMALFGDRAWALPRWLDRALPDLDVEGQHLIEELDEAEEGEEGAPDHESEPADRELVGV